jgi:hypothetical protein
MAKKPAAQRMEIVHAEIDRNFRAVAYAMVNSYLNQQRIMADALGMTIVELTVFLIVSVAGVQRLVRQPDIPEQMRGTEPLPVFLVGTISRRAVAEASGLPRETVRRIIAKLIRRGHLIESGPRAVATARGSARREHYEHVPSLLAIETLHLIGELQRLRVLVART